MTTPTGYLVNATTTKDASYTDLSLLFKGLTGATKADATGFTNSAGNDLNTIFSPISTTSIDYNTNMISLTGEDLRYVFASINTPPTAFYTVTDATYFESSYVSELGSYTGVVFYIPFGSNPSGGLMTGTITFNTDVSTNIIIVGGGAGGGGLYNPSGYSNYWVGCGGGGGATITVPLSLTGNTAYSFGVGQGGFGGLSTTQPTTQPVQSPGNISWFKNGSDYYNAGGGTLNTYTTTNLVGFKTSDGGSVTTTIASGSSVPPNFIGGGGGGGGGECNYNDASSTPSYVGGTGGSYYTAGTNTNSGAAGSSSFYTSVNSNQQLYWKGGAGGNAYFQNLSLGVSTPFLTNKLTPVGGGGGGASAYSVPGNSLWFYWGYAGLGYAGAGYAGIGSGVPPGNGNNAYGYGSNANNNAYSQYTISGASNINPGPTGPAYGYGAGGGGAYNNASNTPACTGGFGGNGVVMIYWDNTKFY